MATPRPAAGQGLSLTFVRAAPHARPASPRVTSLLAGVSNAALWVNPVRTPPSYGTLRVFTSAQLTSPAGPGTPYAYTLNFANPPGTTGSQHFVAWPADLATVPERYVQDRHSMALWGTFDATPYQATTSLVGTLVLPLRPPGRQVQYISASPPMYTHSFYFEYRNIADGETPAGRPTPSGCATRASSRPRPGAPTRCTQVPAALPGCLRPTGPGTPSTWPSPRSATTSPATPAPDCGSLTLSRPTR
jgi:hypothetical protein